MIGTLVTSRSSPGPVAGFLVLGVLVLVVAGLAQSLPLALLAVLPFALAVAALPSEPRMRFEVTPTGLSFDEPGMLEIRYDDIQGLTAQHGAAGPEFALQIYHPGGVVRIPARLDVRSDDLYDFLYDRLPRSEPTNPNLVAPALQAFTEDQVERFGREKVFVFTARSFAPVSSYSRHLRYSKAVLVTGFAWLVLGIGLAVPHPPGAQADALAGWACFGGFLLFLGVAFTISYARMSTASRVRDWQNSCLVISPGGIALVQGSLRGKMRWEELRAIEYPAKRRSWISTAGASRGIGLLVEGAYLVIADYYERPLSIIHQHLMTYWGGREAN